jgi:uncharacterized membrane protein YraQ (UPF0718 family)
MSDLAIAVQGARGVLRRIDRVWLALGLLFLVLAVGLPEQALDSAAFTLDAALWISPFLAASVLLAAWLKAAGADRLIGALVARSPVRAIVLAAAAGAFSPFCSCGVVPLIAALLAAGVPLPVVMAFWVSSPIMDPEMFVLMWAQLGLPFTLAKTVAALGLGLLGGFATLAAQRAGLFEDPLRAIGGGCGSSCGAPSVQPVDLNWAFWREPARRAVFAGEARAVALFLSKWLLLAFAIESLMVVWLPQEAIAANLGGQAGFAIPLAVAVGVPAYLNGYAAIPLIGELMSMGMAPGAALAFLVAGGVTSLPAAMAVFALVKKPVFLWYLAVALLGSLAIGYAYQGWLAF